MLASNRDQTINTTAALAVTDQAIHTIAALVVTNQTITTTATLVVKYQSIHTIAALVVTYQPITTTVALVVTCQTINTTHGAGCNKPEKTADWKVGLSPVRPHSTSAIINHHFGFATTACQVIHHSRDPYVCHSTICSPMQFKQIYIYTPYFNNSH